MESLKLVCVRWEPVDGNYWVRKLTLWAFSFSCNPMRENWENLDRFWKILDLRWWRKWKKSQEDTVDSRDLHGDRWWSREFCGTRGIPTVMEAGVAGFPRGWKKYFTGFPRSIYSFTWFYGASAPTSESNNFFHVQNLWCMFNYNDNAN